MTALHRLMTGDWKESVDLDELGQAIHDLSGGDVNLYQVETHSDSWAIVLARGVLTPEQAAQIYEES